MLGINGIIGSNGATGHNGTTGITGIKISDKKYKRMVKIEKLFKITYDENSFSHTNQLLRKIFLMVV